MFTRHLPGVALLVPQLALAVPAELSQSGRLLEATGAPRTGTVQLGFRLWNADAPVAPALLDTSFGAYPLDDGYYQVVLAADTDWFVNSVELEILVNGVSLGRQPVLRVPRASVADVATRVPVSASTPSGSCGPEGSVTWDRAASALLVCTQGGTWATVGNTGSSGGGNTAPPGSYVVTTPGEQTWTVPAGVVALTVTAWGAGGSGGNQAGATGGGGAHIVATIPVTPGEDLILLVGRGGAAASVGTGGSAGGGLSGVRRGATPLVIAGGGGGGASDGDSGNSYVGGAGGAGGALVGLPGGPVTNPDTVPPYCASAGGGQGGTQTEGGSGGIATTGMTETLCTGSAGAGGAQLGGVCTGNRATSWQGGTVRPNNDESGGGAGYFGGGAGGAVLGYCSGGAGGGSSYALPTATNVTMTAGSGQTPGEATAGRGGDRARGATLATAAGAHGRLVVSW